MPSSPSPIISVHPDVMGGVAVFAGTRVPVRVLLDHIEAGDSLTEFLEGYPSVSRAHAVAFLEVAGGRLVLTLRENSVG